VDQAPIGRTPRSCPATYIGVFDAIRKLFAGCLKRESAVSARLTSRSTWARAEREDVALRVLGLRTRRLEMSFSRGCLGGMRTVRADLVTTKKRCASGGARRASADVGLAMPAQDARSLFQNIRTIAEPLRLMDEIGVGYLTLGPGLQHAVWRRGSAHQDRVGNWPLGVAAAERCMSWMSRALDCIWPDTTRLLSVLHTLVDRGDTVVLIEHNLDLLREADWVIDLGPGGGVRGGHVVYQGPLAGLHKVTAESATARALARANAWVMPAGWAGAP